MKVGFIGTGIMGKPMCANILRKHDDQVFVYYRTREKIKELEDMGAIACGTYKEIAENADIIFSIVPTSNDSMNVYQQLLPHIRQGQIYVDMGTIEPKVSVEISKMVKAKGASFADAPVVRTQDAAIAGTLGVFVGTDEETFDVIRPFLLYMGSNVIRMGGNGAGLIMKVCQNALTHSIQHAVNETITLAGLYGISVDKFIEAVSYGGARNFYLDNKAEKLRTENWDNVFSINFTVKDLGFFEALAKEAGFPAPGVQVALENCRKAQRMGLGEMDTSATILAVREY